MLEIYSEVVRDLLVPGANRKSGLQVRQDPKYGFYGNLKFTKMKITIKISTLFLI